jgi:hypothetical protein
MNTAATARPSSGRTSRRVKNSGPASRNRFSPPTNGTRYAESDAGGRFLFDGLPEANYGLSVFASGYPKTNQLLAGPRRLHIKEKSCARQIFV